MGDLWRKVIFCISNRQKILLRRWQLLSQWLLHHCRLSDGILIFECSLWLQNFWLLLSLNLWCDPCCVTWIRRDRQRRRRSSRNWRRRPWYSFGAFNHEDTLILHLLLSKKMKDLFWKMHWYFVFWRSYWLWILAGIFSKIYFSKRIF